MSSATTDGGTRLDWPRELDRTNPAERRRTSKFEVTLTQTITDLETEMDRLGVDDWRFETAMDHQSQNPNYPYASQPQPDDPAAVLRWSMDGDQFAIGCDQWTRVRDNAREICLYVAEKRKMEDRPVATGQSEFATARLPPADEDAIAAPPAPVEPDCEPHEVLGVAPDAPDAVIRGAFRELVKEGHADGNGREEIDVDAVRKARDALLEE